jgi:uncharacterized OB-fold protein
MGKWFEGFKEKKFLGNKCNVCGRTQVPPREVCAECRVRVHKYVELGPKGEICEMDVYYYASPDPLTGKVRETPYATIYILLDGSSPDDTVAHRLKVSDIEKAKIGDRVRPVWAKKTEGAFSDLLYFELDKP